MLQMYFINVQCRTVDWSINLYAMSHARLETNQIYPNASRTVVSYANATYIPHVESPSMRCLSLYHLSMLIYHFFPNSICFLSSALRTSTIPL